MLDLGELILLQRSGLFDTAWFLTRNPDLVAAAADPLAHFHRHGWREGRWPNPYFDPAWYCARNPDVARTGQDPLLHYLEYGEAEGRKPVPYFEPAWYRTRFGVPSAQTCLAHFLAHRHSGAASPVPEFDAAYYLEQAPDVAASGMDPFEHYLVQGAQEDRVPSPGFDPLFYRSRYLRHLPDANPLLHYRQHRHEPGVFPGQPHDEASIPQEVRRSTQPGPMFEEAQPLSPQAPRLAKVLAFYLPQFHPVPDNDSWWGKGFTEWTNVARALPRFAGHYQPRIPRDLGHYRLDQTGVLAQQIALARGGGVHGFVFYFYWFNGRRMLDGPLEALLADPALDVPFCLMWANENWTRRWDGSEDEVLLSQDYRDADETALIDTFARHFDDPRYIRLGGRPVLMIYRAGLIPQTAAAITRWRQGFAARGHDPLLVMAQSFSDRDPRPFGMDAAVEFPPHKLTDGLLTVNAGLRMLDHAASARVYDYAEVAEAPDLAAQDFPLIRTALPCWDNDARRQGAGMVLHGSTPVLYQAWLQRLIAAAAAQPVLGEAVVCVNAWNEWAEGAYLEPDVHFGAAYLNATARAVAGMDAKPAGTRLLLVGHDAFPAGAQLLLLHLGRALRATPGLEIAFLLLGGGALAAEYRAVAPTIIAENPQRLAAEADSLAARGFRAALVNSAASGMACARLAKAGVACVLMVHELPRLLRERGLIGAAREGAAHAHHVVFGAPYVRDRFHELVAVPHGRAVVMPQGLYRPVDAERDAMRARLGLPANVALAVGVGYGDLRKGFDLFLQAWRTAQAADPAVHALWAGNIDPQVHAYLGAEMAAAQATGTFHHHPYQPDGADWLAAADVHLLTSREDPLPSVVLEAMSAGVPTVAFEEAGGAPDLLRDYGAGRAVPLADAASMVREALTLVRRWGPQERDRLARAARQAFPFQAYAARLLHLACPALALVSVVVPNFNYARYLPERLRSIFGQTVAAAEVVVLDDGSTDGSEAVVRRVAADSGRTVRWVGSANNSGSVFRQWRRAVALAEGEFVWIAEADDVADPLFIETLTAAMQAAPDAAFGFCDSRALDADGGTLWADHQGYYRDAGAALLSQSGVFPAAQFLREALGARNLVVNASAVLWRRRALSDALDRCGTAIETYKLAGDWRLYAEALAAGGTVAYIAEPLNGHRRHGRGVTQRLAAGRHLNEIKRMHKHLRRLLGSSPGLLQDQRRALADARLKLG